MSPKFLFNLKKHSVMQKDSSSVPPPYTLHCLLLIVRKEAILGDDILVHD